MKTEETTYKKITSKKFTELFRVKEFKGQSDCYGTWNGQDMYALSDRRLYTC